MVQSKNSRRRLTLYLVGGMITIAAVLAYRHFWVNRPTGRGPAGPLVSREPFESTWTSRRVVLLGVGDSVTAGLGARTPEHSFFNRLVKSPEDEFPEMRGLCLSEVLPNLVVDNLARSGTTSLQHLDILAARLKPQDPDVLGLVVVTTGGNDLIHNYGRTPPREDAMYGATMEQASPWIENFKTRLNKMLDMIDTSFPGGCRIFLADIYDPTDGVGDTPSVHLPTWPDGLEMLAKYNDVIHTCAAKRDNVHLVLMHREFLGHGSHCTQFWRNNYRRDDPHYWYFDNIEDPNDRGHDAIRRLFLNEIANVMKAE